MVWVDFLSSDRALTLSHAMYCQINPNVDSNLSIHFSSEHGTLNDFPNLREYQFAWVFRPLGDFPNLRVYHFA
jgi:hypothetical protein